MEWEYERVYPDLNLIPYSPTGYVPPTTTLEGEEGEVHITNRTTLTVKLLSG